MYQKKNYITNIFIDLDGPILDVSERYYQVYKCIIRMLGGDVINKEIYMKLKREKTDVKEILRHSNIEDSVDRFKYYWLDLIEERPFLSQDKIWPSVKVVLSRLRAKHKIILVTLRRSLINLNWQLRRLDLEKYFDLILCKKSNNGSWFVKYNLIKNSKELDRSSCIIGDTEVDILTGKKLGIETVAVLSGLRGRGFLNKYRPDYIIDSLNEIAKI